jgi:Peptidase inhibitor I78 family
MRKLVALCSVALGACSTVPAEGSEPAGGKCRAEGLERYVGEAGSAENGAAILRESGAKTLRWIPHGSAITMDFSEQRVNVRLDPQSRIEAVTCG